MGMRDVVKLLFGLKELEYQDMFDAARQEETSRSDGDESEVEIKEESGDEKDNLGSTEEGGTVRYRSAEDHCVDAPKHQHGKSALHDHVVDYSRDEAWSDGQDKGLHGESLPEVNAGRSDSTGNGRDDIYEESYCAEEW